MKRIALALVLLLAPSLAWAQCNGIFPNNTVCGNISGAGNLPKPTSPTAFQGSAGGTNGQIQYNNGGALGGLTDSQVAARLPFVENFSTRAAAIAATIGSPTTALVLQGYTTANDGGFAIYTKLASAPGTPRAWHFQSSDGAWWQLSVPAVFPKQLGAALNGSTDDTVALQAWTDYSSTFNVPALGQVGTAAIPTGTINLTTGNTLDGLGVLVIQRQSNVVASLLDCNIANTTPQSNITIRGLTLSTTAGFSSTSSNTIGNTTQNYTVPSGLVGLVAGNFVQITANTSNAAHVNYMIAQINSYSGTTLNVTASTSVGSGTFANWLIDSYPLNGDLAASPIAIRATACTNFHAYGNTITGRFYNALDSRNGTDVYFDNNLLTGWVNRGIHMAAYTAGQGAINNQAIHNHLEGNLFSQYGINTSASDGAVAAGFVVDDNRIANTTYQGIIIAGGITSSSVTKNSIQMAFNTNGVGIIIEGLTGTSGLQIPQQITVAGNPIASGLQGIFINNAFYNSIIGNPITAAGTGILVLGGSAAATTSYNTIASNPINGSTSHGISLVGNVSGGVNGNAITGNVLVGNGGWGIISDANTSANNYVGNAATANTSGTYSLSGTGNGNTGNL